MANELTIKATINYSLSNVELFAKAWNVTQDKANQFFESGIVATSTTPSQITITSGTAQYILLVNKSTTSGETIHVQTTNTSGVGDHRFATLPIDGGIALLPIKSSGAIWLQSAAGTPAVEYTLLSN